MNIKNSLAVITTIATVLISSITHAAVEVETNDNGVTLAGHDAVAYFTENAAVEGSTEFTSVHNNAIYYFSSTKNRDLFNENPNKYEPQYGGFCAYGAALGKKLKIDGKAFEVVDGKLYVNKNVDVFETWAEDKAENIAAADLEWVKIKTVPANKL